MTDKKYWIWLSSALGAAARVDEILSEFPNPQTLFEADRKTRILSGVFTKAQLERLEKASIKNAEVAVNTCARNHWSIVTPDDAVYPFQLRQIPDMPLVLYVDGDLSALNGKVVMGVVGTREPCRESRMIARKMSGDLAKAGVVIVSGGALGIDSCAHEGAISAGGKTVCVLGCGLGANYLMSNEPLRREISRNGAVITEYPPLSSPTRASFPERNRIISGLSHGVLVVEAGEKSGSLITARCANNQGRDVFAIPGSILSTAYMGANKLIKDGAKAVTCAMDVLENYETVYPERLKLSEIKETKEDIPVQTQKRKLSASLTGDKQKIYGLFSDEPIHPDELCAMSGLPVSAVITALMELEMDGLIEQTEGKNYILR